MLRDLLISLKIYNFLRIQMLPLKEMDEYLPQEGRIIELGCGDGFITKYLARVKSRQVIGLDLDVSRLPRISGGNLKFVKGDIRSYKLLTSDGIVISDVLHHLNYDDQGKVLVKISQCLKKGRVLIIKEIDKREFVRSSLSRLWDFIFYPNDKIYYWDSPALTKKLSSLGFDVKKFRTNRLYPASTTLYLCTKK